MSRGGLIVVLVERHGHRDSKKLNLVYGMQNANSVRYAPLYMAL